MFLWGSLEKKMAMGETLKVLNQMVTDRVIESYAIGGAVAAINYIEPTLTEDLDILVSFENQKTALIVTLAPITSYLAKLGYAEWEKEGLLIEGWPVQFLPVVDALDEEALAGAVEVSDTFGDVDEITTRILSPEHVIGTALRTGRSKDFVRVGDFLDQEKVDLQDLKSVLERHSLQKQWQEFCRKTGRDDVLSVGFAP
jgi:hypothetical protein